MELDHKNKSADPVRETKNPIIKQSLLFSGIFIILIVAGFVIYNYISNRNNQSNAHIPGGLIKEAAKVEEAISYYKKAIKEYPNNTLAYYNLGYLYGSIGKIGEAVVSYKKVIELDPKNAEAYSNLGVMYVSLGKDKEAISSSDKALEIDPSIAAAHNNLAVVYFKQQRYDLAIQHCDKAIELGHKVVPGFLDALKPYRKK